MLSIDHLETMLMVNPVIIYSRPLRSTDADICLRDLRRQIQQSLRDDIGAYA